MAKDSVSVWVEISNCRVDILVARNVMETIKFGCHVGALWQEKNCCSNTITQRIFSQKKWLVCVDIPYVIGFRDVCDINESCDRALVWRTILTAVQIEGGTAAVGFLLSDKTAKDSVSVWIEISNCRVDILVARNVLETIKFGCHVGALWQQKNCCSNTITQRISSQKAMTRFRGHSLRDWLPWCHATSVNRETGPWFEELSWHLKVPWNRIKRIQRHRVPMQIEGGTAAVGFETMTIWFSFSWIEFSDWSWHFGGKTFCGNLKYIITRKPGRSPTLKRTPYALSCPFCRAEFWLLDSFFLHFLSHRVLLYILDTDTYPNLM